LTQPEPFGAVGSLANAAQIRFVATSLTDDNVPDYPLSRPETIVFLLAGFPANAADATSFLACKCKSVAANEL